MAHLILFDGECGICNGLVRHIIAIDPKCCFLFAPLQSKKSQDILKENHEQIIRMNTIVLIENFRSNQLRIWIRSRAILRIYWIVSGGWKWIGVFSFLPGSVGDLFYRIFAISRHRFKAKITPLDQAHLGRFLDE